MNRNIQHPKNSSTCGLILLLPVPDKDEDALMGVNIHMKMGPSNEAQTLGLCKSFLWIPGSLVSGTWAHYFQGWYRSPGPPSAHTDAETHGHLHCGSLQ